MHGKFFQQRMNNGFNVFHAQLLCVNRRHGHVVHFRERAAQRLGFLAARLGSVHEHNKRLSKFSELGNDPALGCHIAFAIQVGNAAVCGNNNANGTMFCNYLVRTNFRSLGKRHFLIGPGRFHHALLSLFRNAQGARNQISHTINHFSAKLHMILFQRNLHRFLGNEFGFCCHNGFTVAALRQLVNGTLLLMFVGNARQNQQIHEAFNKSGFSAAHRTYDANINIAAGSG